MAANQNHRFCPYCGILLPMPVKPGSKSDCPDCDLEIVNPVSRQYEYKSRLTLFGWPVVHMIFGQNSETKKPGVARGLIALGDIAIGGFAVGGVAIGGVALGGVGIGLLSFAGFSIGLLFALGGMAISGGLGLGGGAVGLIAVGGGAYGYYAMGGGVYAIHGFGGNIQDPIAKQFFLGWRLQLKELVANFGPVLSSGILAPFIVIPFLRYNKPKMLETKDLKENAPTSRSVTGLLICMILGGAFGIGLLWLIAMAITIV